MPAPTVTVDHVRDPVDRSDGEALIRCPEKGHSQIAAGRCVATTDCPRAESCPFRAKAREVVEEASVAGGRLTNLFGGLHPCAGSCGRATRADLCLRCRAKKVRRRCAWCEAEFSPGLSKPNQATCSLSCRAYYREYRKRPKGRALGPEVSITASRRKPANFASLGRRA